MNSTSIDKFGYVGIEPHGTLAETAFLLGRALGGLDFQADTESMYEEYPAYVADRDGLRYALLGVPEPEYDVRDVPTNDFTLMVESTSLEPADSKIDISAELAKKIQESGLLNCWPLD
ncbi:hypothetical protein G3N57_12845 [Paraburkholderia sp. Se-20369]|nr:hypothetical protein [Paraburkholderia sp. Se-20369]